MTEERSLVAEQEDVEALRQRLALNAGENMNVFQTLPKISVCNKADEANGIKVGDLVESIKTDAGYENMAVEGVLKGVIVKVRMYLSTKYDLVKKGAPSYITDEFDSYSDNQEIVVKQKDALGKYKVVFTGGYKEVVEHFTSENQFGAKEKMLDLNIHLYVVRDILARDLVKVHVKGVGRGAFFDYTKRFKRKEGDYMSSTVTLFGTFESKTDYNGNIRQIPVWAFTFAKLAPVSTGEELIALDSIQKELTELFSKRVSHAEEATVAAIPERTEDDIPTINLDEDIEEAVKIDETPF